MLDREREGERRREKERKRNCVVSYEKIART